MDETTADETKKGSGWGAVLLTLLLLAALYVLGVGPATRVVVRGGPGADAVRFLYVPLEWLHDHTPARGPLEWYVMLWFHGL